MIKNTLNIKIKEKLKKDISELHYNEHCEIYNIIRKDTDKISENKNGVFINLKYLNDETIDKIQEFISFCQKNKNLLKKKQKEHEKEMNSVNSDNTIISTLGENYESYSLDKESLENITFSEDFTEDKFTFKNYIDKLSISSNKKFKGEDNIGKRKKIIIRHNNKLSGVNARIFKKCKNLNKQNVFFKNKRNNKGIENILEDTFSNYNLNSSINNFNQIEQLIEDK